VGAVTPQLARWTAVALLVLSLMISPLLGLLTPYVIGLIAVAVWLVTAARGQLPAAYGNYPARAFLFAFALLAVLFALSAEAPEDVLNAFNFTMLLLFGPVALLLARHAAPGNGARIAALATIGVALALAIMSWRAVTIPTERPAGLNIGPIVLSNALLALGFLGLGGALALRTTRGLLFVAAPLLAVAAVVLSGSRGPLLAVPVLSLFSILYFGATRFRGSRAYAIGAVAAVFLGTAAAMLLLGTRSASIVEVATQVATGSEVTDETTRIRLVLYKAGWQAFLQQPWIGHGWADLMEAVKPFLAPEDLVHAELPQLHNDLLNFAVTGGAGGIAAYLLIISAPMIGALGGPRDGQRQFRVYAAAVLTITYACGGLTDLMFGFEFHTALFAMLTAIILCYGRDARPAGTPQ
jgi:O-antigen ligase